MWFEAASETGFPMTAEGDEAPCCGPDAAWADWSHDGLLLVATRDGRLQRFEVSKTREPLVSEFSLVDLRPNPEPAAEHARHWW